MMRFVEYPDADMMMLDLAGQIVEGLENVLLTQDRATLSVPGGTTPGPIFDVLSEAALDWARVSVVLNDERWVPEDSPRSNTALLRQRLLVGKAAAATLVPLYAATDTPEESLESLSREVAQHLPLSVLLLGMGEDMHTASLFPGADQLDTALSPDAPAVMALRAPGAPEPRITLTAPILQGAMETHIVIKGAGKRAALEQALTLPPAQAPVAAVLPRAVVHWAP